MTTPATSTTGTPASWLGLGSIAYSMLTSCAATCAPPPHCAAPFAPLSALAALLHPLAPLPGPLLHSLLLTTGGDVARPVPAHPTPAHPSLRLYLLWLCLLWLHLLYREMADHLKPNLKPTPTPNPAPNPIQGAGTSPQAQLEATFLPEERGAAHPT